MSIEITLDNHIEVHKEVVSTIEQISKDRNLTEEGKRNKATAYAQEVIESFEKFRNATNRKIAEMEREIEDLMKSSEPTVPDHAQIIIMNHETNVLLGKLAAEGTNVRRFMEIAEGYSKNIYDDRRRAFVTNFHLIMDKVSSLFPDDQERSIVSARLRTFYKNAVDSLKTKKDKRNEEKISELRKNIGKLGSQIQLAQRNFSPIRTQINNPWTGTRGQGPVIPRTHYHD